MAKLTARRLQNAKPIFDRHLKTLLEQRQFDFGEFEQELRDLFKLGYQELKPIVVELSQIEKYEPLAVKYMEGEYPRVVMEFHRRLEEVYGIDYFYGDDRDPARDAYWARFFPKAAA